MCQRTARATTWLIPSATPQSISGPSRKVLLARAAKFCDDSVMDQALALDSTVRDLLAKRRGDWPRIAREADVSHSWMSQFVRGKIPNPGYATLRKLYEQLSAEGPKLENAA